MEMEGRWDGLAGNHDNEASRVPLETDAESGGGAGTTNGQVPLPSASNGKSGAWLAVELPLTRTSGSDVAGLVDEVPPPNFAPAKRRGDNDAGPPNDGRGRRTGPARCMRAEVNKTHQLAHEREAAQPILR
jgi:hypothetical protein